MQGHPEREPGAGPEAGPEAGAAAKRPRTVLFVCTGNTCRSPMAAAFAQAIADDLAEQGIPTRVISAGISAAEGYPASPEAVEALARLGIDLRSHRSRALTPELLDEADVVFAMTEGHAAAARAINPSAAEKILLLDPNGQVPDPYGGPIEIYEATADRLRELVARRLKELSA
jgi:protein-tyrosine-phosphatase